MEEELMEQLRNIAGQLEIPEDDFDEIVRLAKIGQKASTIYISNEQLYQIILNALMNYDSEEIDRIEDPECKYIGLSMLLSDEDRKIIFSDEELKSLAQELQSISFLPPEEDTYPSKRKSLVQLLNRSVRSLGK